MGNAKEFLLLPQSSLAFLSLRFTLDCFIHCVQQMSASGPRFAARMAIRQTLHLELEKRRPPSINTKLTCRYLTSCQPVNPRFITKSG